MTALNELIEIIKQKRKESEISNTLLKFVQFKAEKLLELEKEQQDEFAIGFAEWCDETTTQVSKGEWGNWLPIAKYCLSTKELLEIYKKLSTKELLEIYKKHYDTKRKSKGIS